MKKESRIVLVLLLSIMMLFVSCEDKQKPNNDPIDLNEHLTVEDLFEQIRYGADLYEELTEGNLPNEFEWTIQLNGNSIKKTDIIVGNEYMTLSDDGPYGDTGRRQYAKDLIVYEFDFNTNRYTQMTVCVDLQDVINTLIKYSAIGYIRNEVPRNKEFYSYKETTTYLGRTVDVFEYREDKGYLDRYELYFDRETMLCLKQVAYLGVNVVEDYGYETLVFKTSDVVIPNQSDYIAVNND